MNDRTSPTDVACELERERIAQVLGQDRAWVDDMLIDRRGESPGSNMSALGLHASVSSGECYRVSESRGLVPVDPAPDAVVLGRLEQHGTDTAPPTHAVVRGRWDHAETIARGGENLLGDNVVFTVEVDEPILAVPTVEASDAGLAFYGARRLDDGDVVSFDFDRYPIWCMTLGERYVDDFLMTGSGQGFYVEYHRDQPHWHQPLTTDARGVYFLARQLTGGEKHCEFAITGFTIPHGAAIYTAPGAIHCDAALTGSSWAVGYRDSADFSTALIRDPRGEMVRLARA